MISLKRRGDSIKLHSIYKCMHFLTIEKAHLVIKHQISSKRVKQKAMVQTKLLFLWALALFTICDIWMKMTANSVLVHYSHFWEILSQNWGKNFYSCGFIFTLFLKIFAFKAQKNCGSFSKF